VAYSGFRFLLVFAVPFVLDGLRGLGPGCGGGVVRASCARCGCELGRRDGKERSTPVGHGCRGSGDLSSEFLFRRSVLLTHDHHKASPVFLVPKRTRIKRTRTQRAVVAARSSARQDARVHPGGAGTRRARSARTPLGTASRRGGDGALWARGRRPADARPCVVGGRAVSDEAGRPRPDVDGAGCVTRPNADERAGARAPPRGTSRLCGIACVTLTTAMPRRSRCSPRRRASCPSTRSRCSSTPRASRIRRAGSWNRM
jgi:hypothetical protein